MSLIVTLTRQPTCGVVICLERGADLHMAQQMPLPLTVSCFSKIQIGFTYLVPAHPGSPGQWAVKQVCVLTRQPFVENKSLALCSWSCLISRVSDADSGRYADALHRYTDCLGFSVGGSDVRGLR